MFLRDLPATSHVCLSADQNELAQALGYISDSFGWAFPIEEAPVSCRVLLHEAHPEAVPLPSLRSGLGIVADLRLLREARYLPKTRPTNFIKGWEVRVTCLNHVRAALIIASWIELPTRRHPFGTPLIR